MTQNAAPKFRADSPLEAAAVMLFGILVWSVATAICSIARNMTQITGIARHSPWFALKNGRPMTDAERQIRVPGASLQMARGFGRNAQVLGLHVVLLGLVGLSAFLLSKTF